MLLLAAVVLFTFIYFFERTLPSSDAPAAPPPRLVSIQPQEVTAVQLRRTNHFVLRVERTNETWNLTAPISYPAADVAIEQLLSALAGMTSYTYISPEELKAGHKSIAEFGLDVPVATLTLQYAGHRTELLFGNPTASGDLAYFQTRNTAGVYVVPVDILKRLPQSANEWRDLGLVNLTGLNVDRFEVRSQGRAFAIQLANGQFILTKPTPARADKDRVMALLRKVQMEPVKAFVAEDVRTELDQFGLQPPETELVFGKGTNDLVVVQFGKSPSNDVVYARRMLNNNVVLVSRSVLEAVQVPATELRDRHLLTFDPATVDSMEIFGEEHFNLRRQGASTWLVNEPQPTLADSDLVRECLNLLSTVEGDVEKDVVTDFGMYGLAQPIRQYVLKSTTTNSAQITTNLVLSQLDVGGRRDGKVFARGSESTVYSVESRFIDRLPAAAWQVRDRRVWSFSTNQVTRLTIGHKGNVRQLLRGPGGQWKLDSSSQGLINNTHAVEETVYRLGELRATVWVDRGEGKRQLYGFRENGDKLVIELKIGDKSQVLSVEFGDFANDGYPYALAVIDGQSWIFEFPLQLYLQLGQRLFNQVTTSASANASL